MPGVPAKPRDALAVVCSPSFLRGVRIQQIRLQHAVLDDHCAARGNAFAIEWAGAEAAGHGAVVDHGHVIAGNLLSELAGEERSAAIDRVAIHAFEDVLEDRARDHRIEDDRHLRGLHLARAQTAQGALGGDGSHLLGRFQRPEIARHREPVIALHGAALGLRDGNGGNRAIRTPVLADEPMRVGQNLVAGGGIERSAFGILDARIEIERGLLRAARVVDALCAGKRINVW